MPRGRLTFILCHNGSCISLYFISLFWWQHDTECHVKARICSLPIFLIYLAVPCLCVVSQFVLMLVHATFFCCLPCASIFHIVATATTTSFPPVSLHWMFFTASLSRCILCFLFSPWLYARGFSAIIKNLLPIVIGILVYTHMIILVLINIASTSSVCATYLPSLFFCFTLSPFCSRIVLHLVCLP